MEIDGIRAFTAITPPPAQPQKPETGVQQPLVQDKAQEKEIVSGVPVNAQPTALDIDMSVVKKGEKAEDKRGQRTAEGEAEASDKMLKTAIESANKQLKNSQRKLQCSMHEKTKRIMVKVINTETDELVREIPPEKTLDLFAKVLEMAGILFDEKK